jgi:SAM-dependent methyltransferase
MTNTRATFADKWANSPRLVFDETSREGSDTFNWILGRNGFESPDHLRQYLSRVRRVLDAGCGNGRVTALLRRYSDPVRTEIIGIDLVSAAVARANLAGLANIRVEEGDLLGDLTGLGAFDFIYCQEVLHHTGDPAAAFHNLAARLAPGGEIAVYVYKKKAPVREFVDDYVRDHVAGLSYEEALAQCRQITELGRALSELQLSVTVPAVDVLEIPAGTYDIQRFFYHFFMKCFWNPALAPSENDVVNYDWYHPQDCTRHTPDEVRAWFHQAGLDVVHEHVDFYGITLRGRRA